ncbi:MAG: putative cobaltochelatase [Actinomycetota bacterium]
MYPFTAIVGQEKMKMALILNAINPKIGGVLIRGHKGTAKSTAVRGLADLLPEIEVVEGCPYSCDPHDLSKVCPECKERIFLDKSLPSRKRKVWVVELPVSATEDRVVGSIDFEYAIREGRKRFEPGLLALANRGIIYVDEVNLLNDHIVDVLLDAAAMGINEVEREGVSYSHPAHFILVGTMNPEEGELRPQLLDRFGLCVRIEGISDPEQRVELIKRREEYDVDPEAFIEKWRPEQKRLTEQIFAAQERLEDVMISSDSLKLIARICLENCVAGHRADVVMDMTARTIAALKSQNEVGEEEIFEAAELVLPHRMREVPPLRKQQPPPEPPHREEQNRKEREEDREEDREEQKEQREHKKPPSRPQSQDGSPRLIQEIVFAVGKPFPVRRIEHGRDGILRRGSGRRSRTKTASKSGRYVKSTEVRMSGDIALDATLRAAAPYQLRRKRNDLAIAIETEDIREKIREKRIGNFLLFVVDASGSMGANRRMIEAKGAILSLLLDAYQKRDKVGMVTFRKSAAEILLPPTSSVELAQKRLEELPTGGRTPLSRGLALAHKVAKNHLRKDPNISPLLVVITDGKANVSIGEDDPFTEALRVASVIRTEERVKSLVIDAEANGFINFGLAEELAQALGGQYFRLEDLRASSIVQVIKEMLQ